MTAMSNDQWNNGQGNGQWQPQSGQEWPDQQAGAEQQNAGWDAGAQPQQSAQEWNQQPAQDWNQQQGQDWNAQPQASADWNQQAGGQNWQQQPAQPGWNPQGGPGMGGPGFMGQPQGGNGFANIFDFSMRKKALPSAGGLIFLIISIVVAVEWLLQLFVMLDGNYSPGGLAWAQFLIVGLGLVFAKILLARVFIEGMSALVKRSEDN